MSSASTRKKRETTSEGQASVWLEITTSEGAVRTPIYQGVYLLGRSKKCQLRPKSKSVSRKHCAIICHNGHVFVRDIGSKHGTFINRHRIADGVLQQVSGDDELIVGGCRFHFRIGQPGSQVARDTDTEGLPTLPNAPAEESILPKSSDHQPGTNPKDSEEASPEPAAKSRSESQIDSTPPAADTAIREQDHEVEIEDFASEDDGPSSIPDLDSHEHFDSAEDAGMENVGSPLKVENEDDILNILIDEDDVSPKQRQLVISPVAPVEDASGTSDADDSPKPAPQRKFKYKDKKKAKDQAAEEAKLEERRRKILGDSSRELSAFEKWLDSDSIRPVAIALVAIVFACWIIFNIYQLVTWDG